MNEAIKLAIEKGGYKAADIERCSIWHQHPESESFCIDYTYSKLDMSGERGGHVDAFTKEQTVLDPLFWQALGRALGWSNHGMDKHYCLNFPYFDWQDYDWVFYAHQYFDLVLTNGDTEKFWKDLTKSQ